MHLKEVNFRPVTQDGRSKQGLALVWFKEHFIPNIGMKRQQILILDGHNSHNFVELIQAAVDSNIVMVELPEHTSHWLQPWDRDVFGPLKRHTMENAQAHVREPWTIVS